MKIISLVNSKGGTGKSTLSINLARYTQIHRCVNAEKHTPKVLLVDSDQNGTVKDWHEAGGNKIIDAIFGGKSVVSQLRTMNLDYDYIFIDTPGRVSEIMASAIVISDLVLIPVQPSAYDLWGTSDALEIVDSRQTVANGKPLCKFLLNRCRSNTNLSKDVKTYLHTSTHGQIHTNIEERVIFAESGQKGRTVFESGNLLAIDSIIGAGNEIMEILDNV